jgi:hypothetical protein
MSKTCLPLTTLLLVALRTLGHASDLPVTYYSVQDKPLKAAVTGTPLTFSLFSDAACTQRVYQATVPVQNVMTSPPKSTAPQN